MRAIVYSRPGCVACSRVIYMLEQAGIDYEIKTRQYGSVPEIEYGGRKYRPPITYDVIHEISLTKIKGTSL